MVKQCRVCHATFSLYKNWVTTDDQLTCERCAKKGRDNHDRDEQHRRDLESRQAAGEIKQSICSIQRDVLIKQAEERAKATASEEERKIKESEDQRKIREAEEVTRQKELHLRIAEEERKGKEIQAQHDAKAAEETTKQKQLELDIARERNATSEAAFQNQLKLKEFDLKIADFERRKAEAESSRLRAFQNMDAQGQQRFSEAFGNRLNITEHENLPQSRPGRRNKAPWTALHCTLNNK